MSNARTFILVAALLPACREHKTGPDANYEQGARIYQQLYATELDEAYGDPRMNEAADLLRKVNPHSVDAEAAQRMLASIDTGRAELSKQRADREKMAAAVSASVRPPSNLDPQRILAEATPDAGVVDPFGPGAAIAELNASSGGCLTEGEPFREQGTGATGTVYRLGKSEQCTAKFPGLVGQVVLVTDGHIYRRMADPTLAKASEAARGDAGTPYPPGVSPAAGGGATNAPPAGAADGGSARTTSANAARTPPPPPPASTAQAEGADAGSQMYVPGMPLPEGTSTTDQEQH
ncbi:MAG TPA: hypothetical protein VGH20_13270 [Myxococcales bacterium]